MQRFCFEIIDMQGFEIAEQQYRSRHYCINCGIFSGGELGIRTLGEFPHTAFRVLHLRPLGQLSVQRTYYTQHP